LTSIYIQASVTLIAPHQKMGLLDQRVRTSTVTLAKANKVK